MTSLLSHPTAVATAAPAPASHRELHLTSPPMSGSDVLDVQQRLSAGGYAPGRLDAVYGPATAGAVRAFQSDHGLEVDGIVGPQTWRALLSVSPPQVPMSLRRKHSATGLRALHEARRHLGDHEVPAGSNRTHFGRWFGVDGVPWCAIFVSYCLKVGADYTLCHGFAGPGVYPKGCAYVPTVEAALRAGGDWVGRTAPRAGDLAIYNWDGGVPDHIGIVERNLGNGHFYAIEGNTEIASGESGGRVMRRLRYLTEVGGFGRIGSHRD